MHVERSYSDAGLVNALKQPVEMNAAIGFIYREYYGMLENYVVNNNGSRDDAADVIQETIVAFVEIVQQGKFRGDSSIKSLITPTTCQLIGSSKMSWPSGSLKPIAFTADSLSRQAVESERNSFTLMSLPATRCMPAVFTRSPSSV